MNPSTGPLRRTRAAGIAAALGLAGLAVLAPASAHADPAAPTLTWAFSQYLEGNTGSSGPAFTPTNATGGATIDTADKTIVFGGGTGSVHTATGTADLKYTGSIEFLTAFSGTTLYEVTFADPEVVTDATGAGKIVADVSWDIPARGSTPEDAGQVDDVVLTTFTATPDDWDGATLSATPLWTGAAPADAYGTGKPVDGASWAPSFVNALPTSINPFFYASGSSLDAAKAPSAFTAVATGSVAPVTLAVPKIATTYGTAATLAVSATGVTTGTLHVTGLGAAQDVAVAGGKAIVTVPAGLSAGLHAVTVAYAGDTAHEAASAAATVTVSKAASSVAATWTKKPTARKKGKVAVTVAGVSGAATPTGTVKVVLTHGKKKVAATGHLAGGKAVVKVKRLAKGKWKVATTYAGDADYSAATGKATLKIKR
jgi:hypothetical protein